VALAVEEAGLAQHRKLLGGLDAFRRRGHAET
jgi:hypothetical protein